MVQQALWGLMRCGDEEVACGVERVTAFLENWAYHRALGDGRGKVKGDPPEWSKTSGVRSKASAMDAGRTPVVWNVAIAARRQGEQVHDVSILMATAAVDARCRGWQPASKRSMMSMRAPQHGHGVGSMSPAVGAVGAARASVGAGGATSSSARIRGEVLRLRAARQQPVVADAVKALRQHMHEEAADELVRTERHRRVAARTFDPVVLDLERDASCRRRRSAGGWISRRDGCSVTGRRARPSARRTAAWRRRTSASSSAAPGSPANASPSARCACVTDRR